MIHNNHCFNCGGTMLDADGNTLDKCRNPLCRSEVHSLPVWPWSRCEYCKERAFTAMDIGQLFQISWILLLGLVLFFVGFFNALWLLDWLISWTDWTTHLSTVFSAKLEIISLILIVGWFINRASNAQIRSYITRCRIQEQKRSIHQNDFDSNIITPTPHEIKSLKDEYDKINSLRWILSTWLWIRTTVNALTLYFVLMTVLFLGPGRIISWTFAELYEVTLDKVTDNDVYEQVSQEVSTHWNDNKRLHLQHVLIREKNLTPEQFKNIVKHPAFNLNDIYSRVNNSPESGNPLYTTLTNYLNNKRPLYQELCNDKKLTDDQYKILVTHVHFDSGVIKDLLDKSKLVKTDLFDYLKNSLDIYSPKIPKPPTLTEKTSFQQWKERQWMTLMMIEIIYSLILLGLIIGCIGSFVIELIVRFGDEAWDQIKEKIANMTTQSDNQANTSKTSETSSEHGGVWQSFVGSSFAELVAKLMFRRHTP